MPLSRPHSPPRATGSPERAMPVSYDKRDSIGVVTLGRPQARNAWVRTSTRASRATSRPWEDDDEIRCALLTGDEEGGGFSAGANLKDPRTARTTPRPRSSRALPNGAAARSRCSASFEADRRRGERLCGRHRLHRDLLLRSARRLRARGMAAPAGWARHLARLRRWCPAGAVGRQRQRDAPDPRVPTGCGGGAPHRPRPVGGAPWKAHGQGAEVARHIAALPPLAARLAKESLLRGLDIPNLSDASVRRSLPLLRARADRGQSRRPPGLARKAAALVPGSIGVGGGLDGPSEPPPGDKLAPAKPALER